MQQPNDIAAGQGRPAVVGARPKSSAPPGGRERGSKSASSTGSTTAGGAAASAIAAEYRQRLIDLYKVHNPPNVAKVDLLIKKYRGQEEYLYRQVCAKYGEVIHEPLPRSTVSAGTAAGASSANQASARAASNEAVNARPPLRTAGNNVGDGRAKQAETDGAKPHSTATRNGKIPARGAASGTSLLSRIDHLLLGERTGFFERTAGYASSASGRSAGSSSQSGSESASESGSEEDEAEGTAVGRTVAGKAAAPPPAGKRLAAAAAAVGRQSTVSLDKKKTAGATTTTVRGGTTGETAGAASAAPCQEDESEMSDDMLADALAAKLRQGAGSVAARTENSSSKATDVPRVRKDESAKARSAPPPLRRRDGAGAENGAAGGTCPNEKLSAKSKAWGVPPPVRDKRAKEAAAAEKSSTYTAAKPKAKARAPVAKADDDEEDDIPAPPLFEQWLASLKFLVGWNEARPQDEKEVKDAFREHLKEEGIENADVVKRLCLTVVPLLLDVRRIDGAVVKNVKVAVLKGLKTVQVSILRIVAYELCRELEARLLARKKKAEGAKATKGILTAGATYLASDIPTLAKVVQHFRFDRQFSSGLHQLITAIRNKWKIPNNGGSEKADAADDGPKRRKVADGKEAAAKQTRKRRWSDRGTRIRSVR